MQLGPSLDLVQLTQDMAVFGKEKISEWRALFTEHALSWVTELEQASEAGDERKVAHLAHKLKSSCASLGMQRAVEACSELEQTPDKLIPLRQILTEELRQLSAWLDAQ